MSELNENRNKQLQFQANEMDITEKLEELKEESKSRIFKLQQTVKQLEADLSQARSSSVQPPPPDDSARMFNEITALTEVNVHLDAECQRLDEIARNADNRLQQVVAEIQEEYEEIKHSLQL